MRLGCSIEATRWLAAPAVLIAIAIYQVFLVHTSNLTPWKGGGFGMFSTDRNGASRTVRIYLVKRDRDADRQLSVHAPRELSTLVTDLRQAPTATSARTLARVLAVARWREPAELDELAAGGPAELAAKTLAARDGADPDRRLASLLTLPRAWIGNLRSTARHGDGRPVEFDHVVVEVWETRYHGDGPRLRSERLVAAASESLAIFTRDRGGL